ncbi:MAG: response regulator [Phenylobacterium sp.]|uniref:response regulator transcription factor n=1 Tax=Phenylobacterium sp. TaxID=1871053 RepID=UPI002734EBA2|nr:response regulator [Phenylobacterium sp.]MDP1642005.1 response regulator [Phenylobacterium sp.]MDP3117798.1 response regulator [Phenylobacterium sp.]
MLPESLTLIRPAPMVVLLDDDAALRLALTFSLEIEGYRVESCATGEELVARDLPDRDACLVLDYRLSGMSGLDVLQTLRDRKVSLPAILITSNPTPGVRARAARLQAQLVEKPLLGDLLLGHIHRILPL